MPGRNHSRYGRNASWAKLVMGETLGYHQNTPMTVYHNTPMTTNTSAIYSDTKFSTLSTDED